MVERLHLVLWGYRAGRTGEVLNPSVDQRRVRMLRMHERLTRHSVLGLA